VTGRREYDGIHVPLAVCVRHGVFSHGTSAATNQIVCCHFGRTECDRRKAPPTPCIKGDALSIRICQDEYTKGVDDCKNALRARLTLNKGDKPYIARDLSSILGKLWKTMVA